MAAGVLVILGSARKHGNTRRSVDAAFADHDIRLLDLLDYRISFYEYHQSPDRDDFLSVAHEMTNTDAIVFATPVYWYAISAHMKALLDRLTDFISVRKDIGRHLRDRAVYLIASGTDPELPEGFEVPFALTCQYLGMRYSGAFYHHVRERQVLDESTRAAVRAFGDAVFAEENAPAAEA